MSWIRNNWDDKYIELAETVVLDTVGHFNYLTFPK